MSHEGGSIDHASNLEAVVGEGEVETPTDAQVIEDSEEEQTRKALLEQRIQQQGEREAQAGSPRTMIDEAKRHIGYRERGDNDTKFNRWLGPIRGYPHAGYGYPWCHAFVSYCLWHSGNAGVGPRTAGCEVGVAWFRSRNRYYSRPKVGDLVYYGAGGGTHVELVAAVTERTIRTVGGNTGGSLAGNYFNGDGVYEKTIDRSASRIHGYGCPSYGSLDDAPATPITPSGP